MVHVEGRTHPGPKGPTSLGQEPGKQSPEELCVLVSSSPNPKYGFKRQQGVEGEEGDKHGDSQDTVCVHVAGGGAEATKKSLLSTGPMGPSERSQVQPQEKASTFSPPPGRGDAGSSL